MSEATPDNPETGAKTIEDIDKAFEKFVRAGLDSIDSLPDSKLVQELREYREGIGKKFEDLKRPVGLTPQRFQLLYDKIPPEDRGAVYDEMILAVRDTGYLHELEGTGIIDGLLNGLENGKYGAFAIFLEPDGILARALNKSGAAAAYFPEADVAMVTKKPPSDEEIWSMLACEGVLPRVVADLDHELQHDAQTTPQQRAATIALLTAPVVGFFPILNNLGFAAGLGYLMSTGILSKSIIPRLDNDPLLVEIAAYANAQIASPTANDPALDTPIEAINHVLKMYETNGRTFGDGVIAYMSILTLRLFGMDDKEIGELVSMASFDEEKHNYPKIQEVIDKYREDAGLNEAQFYTLIQAMNARDRLEHRHSRYRAIRESTRVLEGKWAPQVDG